MDFFPKAGLKVAEVSFRLAGLGLYPQVFFWGILFYLIGYVSPTAGRVMSFPYAKDSMRVSGRIGDGKLIADLNGLWEAEEGKTFSVPFCTDDFSELELRREFFLTEMPKDTMVLYFEGVMWTAEVYINDRLMYIIRQPFSEHLLKLPPQVLNAQWNKIKVRVSKKGPEVRDAAVRMLGIHKPVYLFSKPSGKGLPLRLNYPVPVTESYTLVYIPFSEKYGYNIDLRKAEEDFRLIRKAGVKSLYFPFEPSLQLLDLAARMGLGRQTAVTSKIAVFRRISYRLSGFGNSYRAWLDEDDRKTVHFGKFEISDEESSFFFDWNREKMYLLAVMLIPLLLIVLWKVINDRSFKLMLHLSNLTFNHNELVRGGTTMGATIVYFNAFLRILLTAFMVTMGIYYLKSTDGFVRLDIFTSPSPFRQGIEWVGGNLPIVFGTVTVFLTVWQLFRSFVLNVSGFIYNKSDFNLRILIIENCADLPFIIYLAFAWFAILLSPPVYHPFLMKAAPILAVIFLIRKYVRTFILLDNVLKLPLFINFVYICALDWLPWVLLL